MTVRLAMAIKNLELSADGRRAKNVVSRTQSGSGNPARPAGSPPHAAGHGNKHAGRRPPATNTDKSDPKPARQAMGDSDARYRQIFDTVSDAIVLFNAETRQMVDVNQAALRMYGYTREEFLTLPQDAITTEPNASIRSIQQLQSCGEVRIPLRWHRRKDGTRFPVEISASIVQFKGIPLACGVIRDITQRLGIEQELQQSEAKYHGLIENLNDVVYDCDAQGVLQYISPQIERMGLRPQQLVGRSILDLVSPEDRVRVTAEFERSMLRGEEFPSEFRIQDANGQVHWFEDHGRARRDEQGRIVGMTGVIRDVTAARSLKDEIHESRLRLDLALSATELGLWDRDLSTGQLRVDERWAAILGYDLTEAPHDSAAWQALVHPKDVPRVLQAMDNHLAGRTPFYAVEFRMRAKSGEWRWIESHGRVVARDNEGNPARLVGTHRDITERRLAHEQRARYQRNLRSLAHQVMVAEESERRRLATDLHDGLGQLLNLARMKLGTWKKDPGSAALGDRMSELAGLLDQAVHQAGTLTFQLSPPLLYELGLLPACRWLAEEMQSRYGLAVVVHDDGQIGALDEHLATVAFRAIRELLINVAKHAKAERATVCLAQRAGTVHLKVEDHGVGFDTACEPHRLVGEPGRCGFGLFSIRERLKHMGGCMEICSQPGRGTTVTLAVPTQPPAPVQGQAQGQVQAQAPGEVQRKEGSP